MESLSLYVLRLKKDKYYVGTSNDVECRIVEKTYGGKEAEWSLYLMYIMSSELMGL